MGGAFYDHPYSKNHLYTLCPVNLGTAFAGDSGAVDVNDEIKTTTIFSLHDGPLSRAQDFMVRDITE